jgi:putative ABC transport system substrate-binding protein
MGKKSATIFAAMTFFLLGLYRTEAQQSPRKFTVGILIGQSGPAETQSIQGLRDGLKELGYKEGEGIVFDIKDAKGDRAALKPGATELVSKKAEVIFTAGTRATLTAMAATRDIPIVFRHPADPVKLGFVKSMKRPGGNVTGVAALAAQATERRLEILKEVLPKLTRVHIFYDSNNPFSRENFAAAKKAAANVRLEVAEHGIKTMEELKSTLSLIQKRDEDAIFHVPDDLVESQPDALFDLVRQKGLPTMFDGADWAIKGSMLSYGANYYQMGRQAASLIDKILKGKKPRDLPVEQAKKFDLLINFRMANAIGVNIPPDMLKKADKVIR